MERKEENLLFNFFFLSEEKEKIRRRKNLIAMDLILYDDELEAG